MPRDNRMHKMGNAYHSYHGKVHNVDASRKVTFTVSNRVPMNTVSAGHLEMLPAHRTLKESWESVEHNIRNS